MWLLKDFIIYAFFSLQWKHITHYVQGWNHQTGPQKQRQTVGNPSAPLDRVCAFPYISHLINSSHNYIRWAAGGSVVTHHYGYTPILHSLREEFATAFLDGDMFNTSTIAVCDVERQVPAWLGAVRWTDSSCANNLTLRRSKVSHLFRIKKKKMNNQLKNSECWTVYAVHVFTRRGWYSVKVWIFLKTLLYRCIPHQDNNEMCYN